MRAMVSMLVMLVLLAVLAIPAQGAVRPKPITEYGFKLDRFKMHPITEYKFKAYPGPTAY